MSAYDIAKDISKIAATANLGKDIIDLLEKKLALLTDEMSELKEQNLSLREEKLKLQINLDDATKQIEDLKCVCDAVSNRPEGFDDTTDKIIDLIFQASRDISQEEIAGHLHLDRGMIKYHFDLLFGKEFIRQTRMGISGLMGGSSPAAYDLSAAGRAYAVKRIKS